MSNKRIPTWDQVILQVLEESKKPMRYDEIANIIIESDLRQDKIGATPANTVNVYLRNKLQEKVVCLGRGLYCLKKYAGNVSDIFSETCDNEEEKETSDALITAYGRFWDREMFISNSNKILGRIMGYAKANPVDFSQHEGVYLLHKGYQVIYVGQAKELAKRIYDHIVDDKRNRWDNFSWFSIRNFENEDDENIANPITKSLEGEALLDTLEALLIETLGPERNKKVGNSFADKEFEQIACIEFLKAKITK